MKEQFKIFILDENEFNDLHEDISEVSKGDLENSFGFANPKTKEAYIKRTGFPEWDNATILHEAQELISKESFHEDAMHIRWKKGRDIIKTFVSPIVGALLAPVTGGLSILGSGLLSGGLQGRNVQKGTAKPLSILTSGLAGAAGATGLAGAIQGGTAAGAGFLSKAGGIAKGALGGFAAPAAARGPVTSFSSPNLPSSVGIGQTIQGSQALGSILPQAVASGFPKSAAAGLTPSVLGQTGGVGAGAIARAPTPRPGVIDTTARVEPITGALPTSPIGAGTPNVPAPAKPFNFKDLITPANVLGASSVLGSTALPSPEFKLPSSFEDLRSNLFAGEGLTPLASQARGELSRIMGSTPEELFPPEKDAFLQKSLKDLEDRRQEEITNLEKSFQLAGMAGGGEFQAEKNSLVQHFDELKQQVTDQANQRKFEFAQNQKYQAIQSALGVGQNEMNMLLGLTGIDVETAASIFNAEVADIEEIRKAMGTLGSELILRGTPGLQQPLNVNVLGSTAGVGSILGR